MATQYQSSYDHLYSNLPHSSYYPRGVHVPYSGVHHGYSYYIPTMTHGGPRDMHYDDSQQSTRKRVPIACERCRKRKIRCSGDKPDGKSCTTCVNANVANECRYNRVGSGAISEVISARDGDQSSSTTMYGGANNSTVGGVQNSGSAPATSSCYYGYSSPNTAGGIMNPFDYPLRQNSDIYGLSTSSSTLANGSVNAMYPGKVQETGYLHHPSQAPTSRHLPLPPSSLASVSAVYNNTERVANQTGYSTMPAIGHEGTVRTSQWKPNNAAYPPMSRMSFPSRARGSIDNFSPQTSRHLGHEATGTNAAAKGPEDPSADFYRFTSTADEQKDLAGDSASLLSNGQPYTNPLGTAPPLQTPSIALAHGYPGAHVRPYSSQ